VAEAGEDRLLTVPNFLSLVRLACIPLFVWLLLGQEERLAAAILLAVLGATDWVDGYVARRFNQVSTVGKVLDPTADRALLLVGIVSILIDGSVPAWIAWLAIAREAIVAIGTLVVLAMGGRRIDVQFVGKVGTFLLMAAFPLFLAGNDADFAGADVVRALAWPCAIAGLCFAWYSVITYVPLARTAVREGRAGRRPAIGDPGRDG
jgi:cardiolipin synthase